jgi:cytochrome P450
MRPRITAIAAGLLDQATALAAQQNGQVDLVEHFARPFPLAVICELLGLPESDRPLFSAWARGATSTSSMWRMLPAVAGIRRLHGYFREQFAACRRQPRPGLLSALVQVEQAGDRLSEDELVAMAFLLLFAGHETTVHLISAAIQTLLEHPTARSELLDDWSLVNSTVDEVLRYASPVQMTKVRLASRDLEFCGESIQRGDGFVALLAAANCDPAQFADPERFDIHRHPNPHITFGKGIHICLGLKLARAEAAIALEQLFVRYPHLRRVAGTTPRYGGRLGMRALQTLPVELAP